MKIKKLLKKYTTNSIDDNCYHNAEDMIDFAKYVLKEKLTINGVVASVLCVNAPETWDITNGKKYKVIKEEENHFTIINDYGKEDSYHKDWLKKL